MNIVHRFANFIRVITLVLDSIFSDPVYSKNVCSYQQGILSFASRCSLKDHPLPRFAQIDPLSAFAHRGISN